MTEIFDRFVLTKCTQTVQKIGWNYLFTRQQHHCNYRVQHLKT